MNALFIESKGQVVIREVERPSAGPGEVLVRSLACGICGSDLHVYHGRWQPSAFAPGHELCAVVEEIGEGVTAFEVGDRVCAECLAHCGTCPPCEAGDYNHCESITFGGSSWHGGMAAYSALHASSLFRLPESFSAEQGVLIEPLAVSWRAASAVATGARDTVVVIGAGTIGLMAVVAARARSAERTIVTAKYDHQAAAARALGADEIVMVGKAKVADQIKELTGGRGANVVIETTGGQQGARDALAMAAPRGRVSLVGNFSTEPRVPLQSIVSNELDVVGSSCYATTDGVRDFESAIRLIEAGEVDAERIVTHRFPLAEGAEAFRVASDKSTGSIKVLLLHDATG